ncbi:MAG: hydroxyethylthiazole kinase [Pseudomonadota bacterium]
MLISPPFLPAVNGVGTDAWFDTAMAMPPNREGAYPVTSNLGWHGGIHLEAPQANGVHLPVRAIADGTVVFVRQPTAVNPDPAHPLNYSGGQHVAGWTSDGCVIIRHDTEIGEGEGGVIRYFSVYMHLQEIQDKIASKKIFRKDKIGNSGLIYGKPGRIHLEIICDDENVGKIVGRAGGDLAITENGRSTTIYGDMHFHLPAGTRFMSAAPGPAAAGTAAPTVVHTSTDEMFVGVRFGGHGFNSSYDKDGLAIGTTLQENDYEYELFTKASKASSARPSAAFELLRFGRIIKAGELPLTNASNWRKINYPGGQGFVDLALPDIHKFSDADFPHWRGWSLIDDSADMDSRVDSPTIKSWLDVDKNGAVSASESLSALANPIIQTKLNGVICKIPTEWESATIDKRWGWLKEESASNFEVLSSDDFAELKKHIEALTFWEAASAQLEGLSPTHWHFHPAEFIRHFRKCGWLSENELFQSIPVSAKKLSGLVFHQENIGSAGVIQPRIARWKLPLNRALRKYNMDQPLRRLYFFANVWEETGYLRLMVEGNGSQASYAPWFGRGLIQLTHLSNYKWYGKYRGFPSTLTSGPYEELGWNPDLLISQNDDNCIDTAVYWINPSATAIGKNILREADTGYSQATSMQTAKGTNGNVATKNLNGLDGRLQIAVYLKHALLDAVREGNTESMTFAWRKSSAKTGTSVVNGQVKHFYEDFTHTIDVNITPRRPNL